MSTSFRERIWSSLSLIPLLKVWGGKAGQQNNVFYHCVYLLHQDEKASKNAEERWLLKKNKMKKNNFSSFNRRNWQYKNNYLLTKEGYRAFLNVTLCITFDETNNACVCSIIRLFHFREFHRTVSWGEVVVKEESSPFIVQMHLRVCRCCPMKTNCFISLFPMHHS